MPSAESCPQFFSREPELNDSIFKNISHAQAAMNVTQLFVVDPMYVRYDDVSQTAHADANAERKCTVRTRGVCSFLRNIVDVCTDPQRVVCVDVELV